MKIHFSRRLAWLSSVLLWASVVAQGLQAFRVFVQRLVTVGLIHLVWASPAQLMLQNQVWVLAAGFGFVFIGVLIVWIGLPQATFSHLLALPASKLQIVAFSIALALSGIRIAQQVASTPLGDFLWSAITVSLVFLFVPLMISLHRGQGRAAGLPLTLGLLIGFLMDILWRAAFWTLDLNWQPGTMAMRVVVGMAFFQGVVAWLWYRTAVIYRHRPLHTLSLGQLWLAVFLMQNLTHHLGLFQVRVGWTMPASLQWLAGANILGVIAILWLQYRYPRRYPWWLRISDALLASSFLILPLGHGVWFACAILAAQIGLALHINLVLKQMDEIKTPVHLSNLQGALAYMMSFSLYVFFGSATWLMLLPVGLLLWVTWKDGLWHVADPIEKTTPYVPLPITPLLGLLLSVFLLTFWSGWLPTQASVRVDLPTQVRIMYLNIHQGMDSTGEVALEHVAELVQTQEVDVLALNEASREWPNGGYDVPLWLAHRLGWQFVYGPDAGDLSGNAILSRYPLRLVDAMRSSRWPFSSGGFLTGAMETANGPLYITTMHLEWGAPGATDIRRAASVKTYLEAHADLLPRMVIGGDFNTESPLPQQALLDAGFQNVWGTQFPTYTWYSKNLQRTLDFVFVPQNLTVSQQQVLSVDVSDHLPLMVDIVP